MSVNPGESAFEADEMHKMSIECKKEEIEAVTVKTEVDDAYCDSMRIPLTSENYYETDIDLTCVKTEIIDEDLTNLCPSAIQSNDLPLTLYSSNYDFSNAPLETETLKSDHRKAATPITNTIAKTLKLKIKSNVNKCIRTHPLTAKRTEEPDKIKPNFIDVKIEVDDQHIEESIIPPQSESDSVKIIDVKCEVDAESEIRFPANSKIAALVNHYHQSHASEGKQSITRAKKKNSAGKRKNRDLNNFDIVHQAPSANHKPYICYPCCKYFFRKSSYDLHLRCENHKSSERCCNSTKGREIYVEKEEVVCNREIDDTDKEGLPLRENAFFEYICYVCCEYFLLKSTFMSHLCSESHIDKKRYFESKKIVDENEMETGKNSDLELNKSDLSKNSDVTDQVSSSSNSTNSYFICYICCKNFKSESTFARHFRTHTTKLESLNDDNSPCGNDPNFEGKMEESNCRKKKRKSGSRNKMDFESPANHKIPHDLTDVPSKCWLCEKVYPKAKSLAGHLLGVHNIRDYVSFRRKKPISTMDKRRRINMLERRVEVTADKLSGKNAEDNYIDVLQSTSLDESAY